MVLETAPHPSVFGAGVQTAWGDHSLAAALRLMTIEALLDPLNQRFQLLCPATIPLRPALFTYTQLMGQPKSRVGWYFGVRPQLTLARQPGW